MDINKLNLEKLRIKVHELALRAGQKVMDIYTSGFEVAEKADQSPVTTADLASNRVITQGLKLMTPDIPILSEESAHLTFDVRSRWQAYWLIDPLDGTKEFIKCNGEFTVNIALIHGNQPVLGVVYAPVENLIYDAVKGEGAFKIEDGKDTQPIHVRHPLPDKIAIVGSRSHSIPEFEAYLERIGDHELVTMGSSLKFCLVAEGRADLYPRFGPTSEWDTAAAQCVLEAAGGHVTDMHMKSLQYNTKALLKNPDFFAFGSSSRDWSAYLSEPSL